MAAIDRCAHDNATAIDGGGGGGKRQRYARVSLQPRAASTHSAQRQRTARPRRASSMSLAAAAGGRRLTDGKPVADSRSLALWSRANLIVSLSMVLIACMTVTQIAQQFGAAQQALASSVPTTFTDPKCQRDNRIVESEAEWVLMILRCDLYPLLLTFEQMLPILGGPKWLSTAQEITSQVPGMDQSAEALDIWREYISFMSRIDHVYEEAMFVLKRKDFCTYPTIARFARIKPYVLGSRMLTNLYELMAIEYHSSCLMHALDKLPPTPYIVRDIVTIYAQSDAAESAPLDLNGPAKLDDDSLDEFDVDDAIARKGPLEEVLGLGLSLSFGLDSSSTAADSADNGGNKSDQFRQECKRYVLEIEERWQSMEMMNAMLSSDGSNIRPFNNYVMRLLQPTKYADICSQLSTKA